MTHAHVVLFLKWFLRALAVVTAVLLLTNWASIGIGLAAVDMIIAVIYEMMKSSCDRRQMGHLPVIHRM